MASQERLHPVASDRDNFLGSVIIPTRVSASVISAFAEVDRAQFMPRAFRDQAYTDTIIDLTLEATISQPSYVARMLNLLRLEGREKVLEIGTATGYQAALLSRLADHVDTVEIDRCLAYWARSNLKRLHYPNITVHTGDGAKGVEERAPFDAIVVTAGLREVPQALIDQLAVGGRLVAPIGELPENSRMVVLTKISESEINNEDHGGCCFVPLYSSENGGWTTETLQEVRDKRKQEFENQASARRNNFKNLIIKDRGEQGYRDFIRAIGRPAASIVDKDLTEGQILDLFDFFARIFKRDEGEELQEETESQTVMSNDAHDTDFMSETGKMD